MITLEDWAKRMPVMTASDGLKMAWSGWCEDTECAHYPHGPQLTVAKIVSYRKDKPARFVVLR